MKIKTKKNFAGGKGEEEKKEVLKFNFKEISSTSNNNENKNY